MRAIETIAEDQPVSLVLNQADAVQVHGYGYYGRYSYGRPDDSSGNSSSGPNHEVAATIQAALSRQESSHASTPISNDRLRLRAVTGVAVALGVLALHDSANAEVSLSVEATAGYTNNLLRQPEGDDDYPVALGLTGTWTEDTRRLVGRRRGSGGRRHVSQRQVRR